MKKTIINSTTKEWVNIVSLPGNWTGAQDEWQVPAGHEIVNGDGGPGHVWNGSTFDPPVVDVEALRMAKYNAADAEFVKRSLIAAEANTPGMGKVRGGSPKDRLMAIGVKANARGQATLQNALAGVHDKLELLKDVIEAAADQAALDAIDVTDNVHW